MERSKKVVVVIPAYNAEKTLERTLDDIPREWVDDIILVDDASRDGTVALARKLGLRVFARIRCPDCAEERLVMFSCRTRGFCPSCHAKRVNHPDLWGPDQSTHAPPFSGDRGRDRRGGRLP